MADVPTREPVEFTAGDTVKWKIALPHYPADDGWTLKYSFRGPEVHDVTAVADGADHSVTIAKTLSITFAAGNYWWEAYASKAAERFKARFGQLKVLVNLETVDEVFDNRTHVKKTLDALEALIEGKATRDQMSYSIEGRTISRFSLSELYDARARYAALYRLELDRNRIKQGKRTRNIVRGRFPGTS